MCTPFLHQVIILHSMWEFPEHTVVKNDILAQLSLFSAVP